MVLLWDFILLSHSPRLLPRSDSDQVDQAFQKRRTSGSFLLIPSYEARIRGALVSWRRNLVDSPRSNVPVKLTIKIDVMIMVRKKRLYPRAI